MQQAPPTVALESTVIAHGLPYPQNIETALALEAVVRDEGAAPCTIGIIDGRIRTDMTHDEIERLATDEDVAKVSRRDIPVIQARKGNGATTVAATVWIAEQAGIEVFATGGIGGVHPGAGPSGTGSFDVSADLEQLAQSPVTVVCAGAKAILDLPATVEALETKSVTVIGYRTDEFPAFYSRTSGLPVPARCDDLAEVAEIIRARKKLGMPGGVLLCVPIPGDAEIPARTLQPLIDRVRNEADEQNVASAALTPFLLSRLHTITRGRTLQANIALLKNNARVAAQLACLIRYPSRRA